MGCLEIPLLVRWTLGWFLGQRLTGLRLPPLWCGKTWALHNGGLASHGDPLMFLDADTEPEPGFLASLVAARERWGGRVSVQPYHCTERPCELLSLLFHLVGLMAVPLGPDCGVAFGPAIITSRADDERGGCHGQIAHRMHPGGLAEMVIGFDKIFATATGEVRWPWMLAVLLWLSGLFWAAWCLPASLLGWPMVGDPSPLPNLVLGAAFALQLLVISHPVGRFGWISLVFPLPVLFLVSVFLLAILNLERGQLVWKGRRVATS